MGSDGAVGPTPLRLPSKLASLAAPPACGEGIVDALPNHPLPTPKPTFAGAVRSALRPRSARLTASTSSERPQELPRDLRRLAIFERDPRDGEAERRFGAVPRKARCLRCARGEFVDDGDAALQLREARGDEEGLDRHCLTIGDAAFARGAGQHVADRPGRGDADQVAVGKARRAAGGSPTLPKASLGPKATSSPSVSSVRARPRVRWRGIGDRDVGLALDQRADEGRRDDACEPRTSRAASRGGTARSPAARRRARGWGRCRAGYARRPPATGCARCLLQRGEAVEHVAGLADQRHALRRWGRAGRARAGTAESQDCLRHGAAFSRSTAATRRARAPRR